MSEKLPKITPRPSRNDYVMTVPAKLSPTGKRYQISGKTEEEVVTNYKKEITIVNGVPKLKTYMLKILYVQYYKNRADTTFDKYEGLYNKHIAHNKIGEMPINEIGSDELTEYFKSFTNGQYQKQTPMQLKSLLRNTFRHAVRDKWITDNPIDFADINYKNCKKGKKYLESFSYEEIEKIEKTIKESWSGEFKDRHRSNRTHLYFYSPMFMVMAYSGLRIGEILGLSEKDIDFDNCVIHVENQIVEKYERDESGKKVKKVYVDAIPKTETSIRDTVLTDKCKYWLEELKRRLISSGIDTEYFVMNTKGKHPTKSNARDVWSRLLEDAGVEYRPPHKLRKTFVSHCITYGGDELSISDVSEMVGHAKKTTTINDYLKTIGSKNTMEKSKIIEGIFDRKRSDNSLTTNDNTSMASKRAQKMREAL